MESEKNTSTEEQQKTEETLASQLAAFPGAPSDEQIEEWKQKLGEIFCSGFSDTEIFIWRPVTRKEFIALQTGLAQVENATQWDLEEKMAELCVLWATPAGFESFEKKAGSLSTLHEQIMQNSNFVNPAMASALVIKL